MTMLPGELGGPSSPPVVDAEPSTTCLLDMETMAPPRYPPSQVHQWLTCPAFWQLSKHWEPRAIVWTPHQLVGTAIHAGIAAWLRPQIAGSPPASQEIPLTVALATLADGYHEQETWALEGLQALVTKGYQRLQRFIEQEILSQARVLAVEMPDPNQDPRWGPHRVHRVVDCILERGGALEVWDWKSKIRLDESYLWETARAVKHNWQLLDYAWHVGQWYGPVRYAAQGLVVLGPKLLAKSFPTLIDLERLTQWRNQADKVWQAMWECDQQDGPVIMNWEACSDRYLHYGHECDFVPACHNLKGNESLFPSVYRRKEG